MGRLFGSELIEPRTGRYVGLIVALLLMVAGVAWAALPDGSSSIWIDEPLDGSVVELGPVLVVGHVSDLAGIESARLEVDGIEIAVSDATTSAGSLATIQFNWTPDAPGAKVLALWAKTTGGDWFGPAFATISVEGDLATTTTTTAGTTSSTGTPSTTTPTTVPTTTCTFGVPKPVFPADNEVFELSSGAIARTIPHSWSYSGCSPGDLQFQVEVDNDPGFETPIFSPTVSGTSWTSPPISCSDYWWRVRVVAPEVGAWSAVNSFIVQGGDCP